MFAIEGVVAYQEWSLRGVPLYMTRGRHGILKAALHSRLAVLIVWGTYNYRYNYLASFPSSCIVHNNDTMIYNIQVYY